MNDELLVNVFIVPPGINVITFKRTGSLSNVACFKHDNNVCACAVSALILQLVANLSPEMDSWTAIFYTIRTF